MEAPHINKLVSGILIALFSSLPFIPTAAFAAPIECECVRWLREVRDINVRGDAYTISPSISREMASVRDVVLFDIGNIDHAAEITGFEGAMILGNFIVPRYIHIIEANYKTCQVTTRKIEWTDTSIKGIYHPL